MKKNLFIFTVALLLLATGCSTEISDKMSVEEFKNYLKDNPSDSIEEAGDCYYKVIKEGTKLSTDLDPERLYSEYDVQVTSFTGKEIGKKHIVAHGGPGYTRPIPSDLYEALGGGMMPEGEEVEIYMSQDDAKKCGLLENKCEYPMVKVNFKKTNIMREFTVYVADKEVKIKLGDDLTDFLKATASLINDKNILVGPGIQIHKNITDNRYVVYFTDQKRGCCVNLVFKGEPLEWVSFYKKSENGIAEAIMPDVDPAQPNKQDLDDAYMVPTSLDEYKML